MKFLKKTIAAALLVAVAAASLSTLNAQEVAVDCGGYGYEQCRKAPSLAPAVALGTIALIGIIAVAVQNNNHSHSHSSSSSTQ